MKTAVVDFETDPQDEDFVRQPDTCYVKALDKQTIEVLCFLVARDSLSRKWRY